jgi:uncharacterized protein (DUF934 family)
MPLIKNGSFAENEWVAVGDEGALPTDVPVLVSLSRWQAERETLIGRNAPVGVTLASSEAPEAIVEDLDRIQIVDLQFPTFKDGRGYSYARLLRERYGFDGEIRASGEVLHDQWFAMSRCGIDVFEVPEGTTLEAFNSAMSEFSLVYQATGDGRKTVMQMRHGN